MASTKKTTATVAKGAFVQSIVQSSSIVLGSGARVNRVLR